MNSIEAVKEARKKAKKRNFTQSFDLFVNFKKIDFSKPENRINIEINLPHGTGKTPRICVITDAAVRDAKKFGLDSIGKKDIEKLAKDKKTAKEFADKYDAFFAETPLMPLIGKELGPILAPKGKMPKPFPPGANLEPLIKGCGNKITAKLKMPVAHLLIGSEKMKDEEIAENLDAAINTLKKALPKGEHQVKSVYLKLTMGPPVRVK